MADIPDKKMPPARVANAQGQPEHSEFEQLVRWIRNNIKVHWQLLDGSTVIGTVNWFDNYNIQVKDDLGEITIPKHSILWYRAAGDI